MDEVLTLWTVYGRPLDHADRYVARLWAMVNGVMMPTNQIIRANTLEALRAQLPPGLHMIPRDPGDDPVIVENWI